MKYFENQIAVITGASSGIGRATALALAQQGANLCLIGRNQTALDAVADQANSYGAQVSRYVADLADDASVQTMLNAIAPLKQIHMLIHSAGTFSMGTLAASSLTSLDYQYQVNVRAPYWITQSLLPKMPTFEAQIVFINSTVGLTARGSVGQYAASKHALKAIADSLREEINPQGIRVLSVYPGRTASPMQAQVHALEDKPYVPENLMQPEDVAASILHTLSLPKTATVTDLRLIPLKK
ncbi:short-chain dehydrogenase reductase sdr [Leptolyngbya sp. Heron Island J]|uniref:SDR family oxidoreductase n=1 Tax=Leptolyngbya sp. Heron Island J TaxID=1385935 RepID=UPI0003B965EC|nr:SDR family NAD(P)-dependent oxidoreductase [Leptolyngbya sp. Heron Island J]ESA36052.1 short-chain dehydrogenase reductase sdr [Leptolyngbya sp. Heron Island J]